MKPSKWLPGLLLPLLFLLLALLLQLLPGFWLSVCRAQAPPQPLAIGQRMPDLTITGIVNGPSPTVRISDYRGKLLLLDFWSTWCGTCKAAMPKLEALQQEFPEELQVLLVTKEDETRVQAFFRKWKNPGGTAYRLPSAVNDTTLEKLFPYRLVPHIVWIGPDGVVKAMTGEDQVTPANIRLALAQGTMPRIVKRDIDVRRPLFSGTALPEDKLLHYAILLKGRVHGLPSGSSLRQDKGLVYGRAITNRPLLELYEIAAMDFIPEYTRNRLLLEVRDEGLLLPEKSGMDEAAWQEANFYSIDLIGPPSEADRLYGRLLESLNTYSPFKGAIERRSTRCLVLQLTGSPRKLTTKGGKTESTLYKAGPKHMRNAPLSYLVNQLLSEPAIRLPVLDETGLQENIDLALKADLGDLPALRKELRRYNLDLVEADRPIDLLVIRDKAPNRK